MNWFAIGIASIPTIVSLICVPLIIVALAVSPQLSHAQSNAPDPRPSAAFDLYLNGKSAVAIKAYADIVDDAAKRQDIQSFQHSYILLLTLLQWHQQTDRLRERVIFGRAQLDRWIRNTEGANTIGSLVDAFDVACLVQEGHYPEADKLIREILEKQNELLFVKTLENKEVLLSWARVLASQGKHQDASSVLYQVLVISAFEPTKNNVFNVNDLCRIADGYLSINQPYNAELILAKAFSLIGRLQGNNAHVFGCGLTIFELYLIAENYDFAKYTEKFLADAIPKIDLLSWEVRIRFAAAQLFLLIKGGNSDIARQRLVEFELLLDTPMPEPIRRRGYSIAAWASISLNDAVEAEKFLLRASDTVSVENLDPIALLAAAEVANSRGETEMAFAAAKLAYSNVSQRLISRLLGAKGERTNLSVSEREILRRFVELGVERTGLAASDDAFNQELFAAMQVLNGDQVPRLTAFSAVRNIVQQSDLRETLRSREHIALGKIASFETLVARMISRETDVAQQTTQPHYGALDRFFGYQKRLGDLDKIIEDRLTNYFIESRIALTAMMVLREHLKPDEALLLFTRSNKGYSIACISQENASFAKSSISAEELDKSIRSLRANLQTEVNGRINDDLSFPADDAFKLYEALLTPTNKCINAKINLVLVLPHELLTVPFNALLTDKTSISGKALQFKSAPWALRRWSFSVATSVQMFVASRIARPGLFGRTAFLGIGDPALEGHANTTTAALAAPTALFASRGLANVRKLRELPNLPETKYEIEHLARRFSKQGASTLLGAQATEKNLRGLDLRSYRIISFATHALVAGEFNGGSEPALVLTPGDETNPSDDGLLTASEVSLLAINADVVVLSACNTATPTGKPDAKGLSELVAAFLFSGARSVVASQWPVLSFAAADLVTRAFELSEQGKPLSNALRVAMLGSMDRSGSDFESHPRVWAPFILIGNGGLVMGEANLSNNDGKRSTKFEWEVNLGDKAEGVVLAIAPAKNGDLWLVGISDPTGDRVSSYIERRQGNGQLRKRIHSVAIAWHHLNVAANDGVLATGTTFSEPKVTAAVLAMFDSQGQELWSLRVDTDRYDEPLSVNRDKNGQITWVIHHTWHDSQKPEPNSVSIITVDDLGKITRRVEVLIPEGKYGLNINSAAVLEKTVLLSAWGSVYGNNPKPRRDPITGSVGLCEGGNYVTDLYVVDIRSGVLMQTSTIWSFWGQRIRVTTDGDILIAGSMVKECSNFSLFAAIVKLDAELKTKSLESMYAFGLQGRAYDVMLDHNKKMVVVGNLETSFDIPPFKLMDLNKIYEPLPFGDLNRDKDKTISAFIVVNNFANTRYTDFIFSDLRGRSFSSSAFAENGDIFVGGTANGSSGWIGRLPKSMGE